MDENTQEIIDELTAQVEEHRDAARTLRTNLAALRRTHAARIEELSTCLERIETSLASTERNDSNRQLMRDFAYFRKAVQLRQSAYAEQVEALTEQRQRAQAHAVTLHEQLESSRKINRRLMSSLRDKRAVIAELKDFIERTANSKPVRASDEELQAERPDLMSIEHPDDLRYLVRRFMHETGVRVGSHENYTEALRALAGALMSIRDLCAVLKHKKPNARRHALLRKLAEQIDSTEVVLSDAEIVTSIRAVIGDA